MTRSATLTRKPSTDQGTFGSLELDTGVSFLSMELPWRDNEQMYSCIPEGVYTCTWRLSKKHRKYYFYVDNVPGRTGIMIHRGNFAGDTIMGYRSDLSGCIALGSTFEVVHWQTMKPKSLDQIALFGSRDAVGRFEHDMRQQTFTLTIKGENE